MENENIQLLKNKEGRIFIEVTINYRFDLEKDFYRELVHETAMNMFFDCETEEVDYQYENKRFSQLLYRIYLPFKPNRTVKELEAMGEEFEEFKHYLRKEFINRVLTPPDESRLFNN